MHCGWRMLLFSGSCWVAVVWCAAGQWRGPFTRAVGIFCPPQVGHSLTCQAPSSKADVGGRRPGSQSGQDGTHAWQVTFAQHPVQEGHPKGGPLIASLRKPLQPDTPDPPDPFLSFVSPDRKLSASFEDSCIACESPLGPDCSGSCVSRCGGS